MRTETIEPTAPVAKSEWRRRPKRPVRELGLVRITVDVPELQYKRLKHAAVEGDVTLRQLILDMFEREGFTNK